MATVALCFLTTLLISAQGLAESTGSSIGDLMHEGQLGDLTERVMEYAKNYIAHQGLAESLGSNIGDLMHEGQLGDLTGRVMEYAKNYIDHQGLAESLGSNIGDLMHEGQLGDLTGRVMEYAKNYIDHQGLAESLGSNIGDLMSQHEGQLGDLAEWVMEYAKNYIAHQVQEVHSTIKLAKEKGVQAVSDKYDHSRAQIAKLNVSKACQDAAIQELLEGRQRNLGSFHSCADFSEIGNDLLEIVRWPFNLVGALVGTVENLILGISRCWSLNLFQFLSCSQNWIRTLLTDLINIVYLIFYLTRKVEDLILDILRQVEYCTVGAEKAAIQDSVTTLQRAYACANRI